MSEEHAHEPVTEKEPRAWRDVFLVVFIAVQVLLPLHYYTLREDRFDERFAWRMFSSVSMMRCESVFHRNGELVDIEEAVPATWAKMLKKRRASAVRHAMIQRLCESAPDAVVTLDLRCKGKKQPEVVLEDGETNLCETLS
ncbi:MAG: hypothetical protein AAF533_00295 [Acidobacteriota bacterium]